MEHISFPSIEQLRNVVKNVRESCDYHNVDYPVIQFTGTVKIHGTNASVVYDTTTQKLWCQSRENIISVERDNAGFAWFVQNREQYFKHQLQAIAHDRGFEGLVVVFGEFAGKGIQKGVAVSEVDKFFCVFDVYFAKANDNKFYDKNYVNLFNDPDQRIFNVDMFPKWTIDIDFNNPGAVSEQLEKITYDVEQECPVGKYFGVTGIGEGVVWQSKTTDNIPGFRFKVKGEKHSVSKVRKGTGVAAIAPEVLAGIEEFVNYSVTEQRLEQGIQRIFVEQGKQPDIKETGSFLKWLFSDVMKEEHDVLAASGLEPKHVSSAISSRGRNWFIRYLDNEAMGQK